MSLKVRVIPYDLNFRLSAGTSRGILTTKRSYFIRLSENDKKGIGECSLISNLSPDALTCAAKLDDIILDMDTYVNSPNLLTAYPSIRFGLETALRSLRGPNPFSLYSTDFLLNSKNLMINGLIWMGDKENMKYQIKAKLESGWHCLKLKIGSIKFEEEIEILKEIRKEYNTQVLELRVDANGAFKPKNALMKLERLSELNIHSIEQPIAQGQWDQMAKLCSISPIPIALDEELIGIYGHKRSELLDHIKPQYIICKPSLLGGWQASKEWIDLAISKKISWWITSALESNIGLNAISQWASSIISENNVMCQGLGTGSLFTNNINSPLSVVPNYLQYDQSKTWEVENLFK